MIRSWSGLGFLSRLAMLSLVSSWTLTPRTAYQTLLSVQTHDLTMSAEREVEQDNPREHSTIFGDLMRVRLPGEDDEGSSFLGSMGVPTFAAMGESHSEVIESSESPKARGLEGILKQGPAFVLDKVLTKEACEQMIGDCESLGFNNFRSGKNHHGAMQILVSKALADAVAQRLSYHIDVSDVEALRAMTNEAVTGEVEDEAEDVRLVFAGLNRRWRIYRYESTGNETFAPHIDAGFPPSGLSDDGKTLLWDSTAEDGEDIVSRLTVLMYLNDDFVGGETNFYEPQQSSHGRDPRLIASVRPVAGSCLLFPQGVGEDVVDYARKHWPLHEGSPVQSGRPKYVIRSDVLFVTQREQLPLHNELFRYDHLVRNTFLPSISSSSALDKNFLSHTSSLYNPHMGVENLGPFLYSFIRFTKKRKIVEIGAGYTSLWILQALKENDEELERIRLLQRKESCRLLNITWSIPSIVENFDSEPAQLLCIDNCLHQKETATGASAVSRSLGLDSYMEFKKGDAFEMDLGVDSVDILWCDFGVGSRMREFVSSAWECLRPGGFLLCHSTLTNQNTREWLEAARSKSSKEVTGIPPEEFVEISLLEPQKRYQNSISVFQKRRASTEIYEEPVYSKCA